MTASVLITGAAKRIGASIAEHFAARGRSLVLHYNSSKADAETLAARLKKDHKISVTLVQADLNDPASLERFWKAIPSCDVFIHNAGVFNRDTLDSFTASGFQDHLNVHLVAPMLIAQGFMKQLPAQASGNIIILGDGSIGASIAPQFFSYAISKQVWRDAIDILAAAVAPRARANLVRPGPTLPGLMDDESTYERLADRSPLKRTSGPGEICAAIDYLLGAPSVTGQMLSLSAGMNLASIRSIKTY